MMYDIWAEGYIIQGSTGGAVCLGSEEGADFKDACANLARKDPEFCKFFDEKELTYWGCRLYPNRTEAARGFG